VTDPRRDLGRNAWIHLHPAFIPDHTALLARLRATLPLRADHITLFGRDVPMPRLTSFHGDPGHAYTYSGRTFEPEPFTPELASLREALHRATGIRYTTVLANHYRDGHDSMGPHSDDEPELGPSRDDIRIASLSLGARRRFVLAPKKPRDTALAPRFALDLGEGDLLLMGGTTQRHYRHSLPKTQRDVGPRLNLTFRVLIPSASR
jgi:alkylated DNA repair dioxygenase AlkB